VLCGRVENLEVELPPQVSAPQEKRGFEVTGCSIEYMGVCPDCQTDGQ
jgi:Fur family ferric uptake transcriptional regulator